MSDDRPSEPPSATRRVLGGVAQVVGVVGALVCLGLALVGFVARGRALDRVEAIARRIDGGIAKGGPLLGAARDRTEGLRGQVSSLGDAVRARAAEPGAAPEQVQALLERATDVSDRYLELRTTYADARETSLSVLDRLSALDEAVPAVSIPQGPADALTALDERLRALDADILGLIGAIPEAGSRLVADLIAEKVGRTETALQAVSDRLVQTGTRLDALRLEVAERVERVRTLLTVAAVVWMLVWLYGALLHVVLFRWARRLPGNVRR